MTHLSCSHCSQLEQICVPVPGPSWGQDLQTVPEQAPRETDPALPTGGRTEPCPHGSSCASSCATQGHAVFTGLSPGEAGQRDLPSTRYREGTTHHQTARTGKGDIAGRGDHGGAGPCISPPGGRSCHPTSPNRAPPSFPRSCIAPAACSCACAKTQRYFCSRFLAAAVEILLLHPRHGD